MRRITMERLSLHPFQWGLPIMQKEIRKFVGAISTLGLLAAGCSETGTIEAKKDDSSITRTRAPSKGDTGRVHKRKPLP